MNHLERRSAGDSRRSARRWRITGAAMLALLVGSEAWGQQSFTVEQALRAPFGSELIAAPTGGVIAWMENILGSRNIWVAEPPAYHGRQLTHFNGDNGRYL